MRTTTATLLLSLAALSAPCHAGLVFTADLTPYNGGIQFSTSSDLVVTNVRGAIAGSATPAYLDFGVGFDHSDSAGDVFYTPSPLYQLYLLTGPVADPASRLIVGGVFQGQSAALRGKDGGYEFIGSLLGTVPAGSPYDSPGSVDLKFDLNYDQNNRLEGGTVILSGGSSVPEPSSIVLTGLAGACGLGWLGLRALRGSRARRPA